MLKWYAIVIKTKEEYLDLISGYLHKKGSNGVLVEDFKPIHLNQSKGEVSLEMEIKNPGYIFVKGYFNEYTAIVEDLKEEFKEEMIELFVEAINDDWKEQWKKSFKRIQVTDNILIKPSWDLHETDSKIQVSLDPGMAFGTGTHETTRLTLEKLENYLNKGDNVLDLGCGSGILSIVASKLGAKKITAIDIDEDSIKASKENLKMNNIENVTLLQGHVKDIYFEKPDIIVANILGEILIKLLDSLLENISDKTIFISSGISVEKLEYMKNLYRKKGLTIIDEAIKGHWCVIVARK